MPEVPAMILIAKHRLDRGQRQSARIGTNKMPKPNPVSPRMNAAPNVATTATAI